MKSKPKILVCPLDWGIGHATRCVPLIKKFLDLNTAVIIASENRPLAFLKNEFPEIKYIHFPGYNIKYPAKGNMALKMLIMLPGIFYRIYKEHKKLKKIIKTYEIDAVFSDNRFGMYNRKVPSVYLSHQIYIQAPKNLKFLEALLFQTHKFFIKKYDHCWIPDFAGEENLSGKLSHNQGQNHNYTFIGPLSRFNLSQLATSSRFNHEILAMISGPEPQRIIFMQEIILQLHKTGKKCLVLGGTPEKDGAKKNENITILPHLNTAKMKQAIETAKVVICRPGYSTLMDLSVFNKKVILIPTPGQTEQEYLARYHTEKNHCISIRQKQMDIEKALESIEKTKGFQYAYKDELLQNPVKSFIEEIKKIQHTGESL